jgi:hypothetical protein
MEEKRGPGRPSKGADKRQKLNVKVDPETLQELERREDKTQLSWGKLVDEAIEKTRNQY